MMDKTMLISNVQIADAKQDSFTADIFIEGKTIIEVAPSIARAADIHMDARGKQWTAFPGFIDVHIHGANGFDAMDATPEALSGLATALPKEGTTSFLATTMTQSDSGISKALKNASRFESNAMQADMLGIHLEGPFISKKMPGAQPVEHIITPSWLLFQKWQELSGGRIKMVTLAPEADNGLAFIESLTADGVLASIGHSSATFDEVKFAIASGATRVTHLYNQMSPFHHRDPGVVGAALLETELRVELIADFIHSHPKAVELAFREIGARRLILITDAMRAKGLAPGTYDLGGQDVLVNGTDARLADGTLAGSILTMSQAVKNVHGLTDCSLSDLAAMTSANAAEELRLANKGSIAAGKDADIAILDEHFNVQMTICRGTIAYRKEDF